MPDRLHHDVHTPDRLHCDVHMPDRLHRDVHTPDRLHCDAHTPDRLHRDVHTPDRLHCDHAFHNFLLFELVLRTTDMMFVLRYVECVKHNEFISYEE